jgi:nucleotide-binding universal stress UspA family protein
VLHAVDISSERLGVDVSPIPEYSVYRLEDARARLDRVVCDTLPGASVNEIVVAGTAHQAIVRLSEDFDVVVVGAHGPRPLHDIFLGSTAAHVVRAAACPVLALPGGLEARAAARTRDIESALAS